MSVFCSRPLLQSVSLPGYNEPTTMKDLSHDALFSPAVFVLGKIHWALLRASSLMNARRYRDVQRHEGFHTQQWTDFGKEVGADEINWWVFKKETQIDELR